MQRPNEPEHTEVAWPVPDGAPVAFLSAPGSPVDRRLISGWIARRQPRGTAPSAVDRLGWTKASSAERYRALADYLERADPDTWLAPISVVWRPKARHGRREGRISDLLLLSNPRDPGRLRQEWIDRLHRDRRVVLCADPARISDLRMRWDALLRRDGGQEDADADAFARFVGRQAAVALGRAETRLIGPRYKQPKLVQEDVRARRSWQRGARTLAAQSGRSAEDVRTEASEYLDEMVASATPFFIDLKGDFCHFLYRQAYEPDIRYDPAGLARVRELASRYPMALLFSHKTYLDAAVTIWLAHDNGISTGHIMGGINMDFALLGPFLRRAGVAFIRRGTSSSAVYRFALREYVGFLAEKRFNLMWAPEGTRSRTGKLAPIKAGILVYVVRAYLEGRTDDFMISPWAIAYDELAEVAEFARYARGEKKEPESLKWFVRYIRGQRNRYGRVWVNFARPISLRDFLGAPDADVARDEDQLRPLVARLTEEIAVRTNEATAITPTAVVCTALLAQGERAFTIGELVAACATIAQTVRERRLPGVPDFDDPPDVWVREALKSLVQHEVVSSSTARDTIYHLDREQALRTSYYRNSICHYFAAAGVCEIALLRAAGHADGVTDAGWAREFWSCVESLHSLLRAAYHLSDFAAFRVAIERELTIAYGGWEAALDSGELSPRDLAARLHPHGAKFGLGSLLENYLLVADTLAALDAHDPVDEARIRAAAMALGQQYLLQHRITCPDAVSQTLMDDALTVAHGRKLLDGEPADQQEGRRALAAEVSSYLALLRGATPGSNTDGAPPPGEVDPWTATH